VAKRKLTYNHPEGVLGFPRCVLRSPAYRDLTVTARCLMLELQDVWKPFEPIVHYSARRAAKALNVSSKTAARAFHELIDHGFIECIDEAVWLNGQARTYRLTWPSNNGREPTNEWRNWADKSTSLCQHDHGQAVNRVTGTTVGKKCTNPSTRDQQVSDQSPPVTVSPELHH